MASKSGGGGGGRAVSVDNIRVGDRVQTFLRGSGTRGGGMIIEKVNPTTFRATNSGGQGVRISRDALVNDQAFRYTVLRNGVERRIRS